MRYSKSFIPTLKEDPADAESISYKLMVRAGLVRKLIAGAYSYLPLGLKVLKNIEAIVREEMDRTGALEMLMPALQPADIWHETGRYDIIGDELVRFRDRTGREMVIGPTHEEVVTDIARNHLRSYRDLPKIVYQIQTKLRDEPRPRFGIIRSKEFIMKDGYSFDRDSQGLDNSYSKMLECYKSIFLRCGLDAIAVEADSGFMGGNESVEFMILSDSGEDIIVACKDCDYKSSFAKAACSPAAPAPSPQSPTPNIKEVDTPCITSIESVSSFLEVGPENIIKTIIYKADGNPIAVLVRGDHDVNEAKLSAAIGARQLSLADEDTILKVTGSPAGFCGPCKLKDIDIIADYAVACIINGIAGANKKDKHIINVFPGRDFNIDKTFDIRYISETDKCPECNGGLALKKAIEIGHVFKLNTKYSDSMQAKFLDSDGKEKPFIMGCYGIGINRIIASVIEQNNDKDGIIWPAAIAPYKVICLPLNMHDKNITATAGNIYEQLKSEGIETLIDDRDISPGIKFKDADLLGIPCQIIVGSKGLADSSVEVKVRKTSDRLKVPVNQVLLEIQKLLSS
jgi:prolyl-tRNA synthetase